MLNGETLKEVDITKYLGHLFSDDLNDDADIARQCRQLYAQGNIILRTFRMCSLDAKLKLFKTYCTPMYTSQLWWNYKKASINKLYIAYHNIFQLFPGLSKYESISTWCALMDVPCCAAVIPNLIFCFICRLNKSENVLIKTILASNQFYKSRIKVHWLKLLHVQ